MPLFLLRFNNRGDPGSFGADWICGSVGFGSKVGFSRSVTCKLTLQAADNLGIDVISLDPIILVFFVLSEGTDGIISELSFSITENSIPSWTRHRGVVDF